MAEQENSQLWEFPKIEEAKESPSIKPLEFSEVDEQFVAPMKSMEELRQEAKEQGYQEGFAQGQKEAQISVKEALELEYQQTWQERLGYLQELIALFEKPLMTFDETLEQQLLLMLQILSEELIRQELSHTPEKLLSLIQKLKDEMGHVRHLNVHLNTADYEKLQAIIKDNFPAHLVADEALLPGDILLETDSGSLRAVLHERIKLLLAN